MTGKPKTKKQSNQKNTKSMNSVKTSNKSKNDAFNFDEEIVIGMKPKKTNNINKANSRINSTTQKPKPNIQTNKNQSNKNSSNAKVNKRKTSKSKKKVNVKFFKAIFKILCLIGLIAGAIAFLMISPVFNITEIEVVNNQKLSDDTYISLSGINYGENIYRISKKEIKEKVKENAYVENIEINRKIPNKLIIDAKERVAKYMIKFDEKYMYIDNQGYMLELSKNKIDFPILKGLETKKEDIKVGNRLCDKDLEKLNKVLEIYQNAESVEINNLITEIDVGDKTNYKLILEKEKKTVHLGEADDLMNKFNWIKVTLEQEKGKKGDIYANRDLDSQPVYFSPTKTKKKD